MCVFRILIKIAHNPAIRPSNPIIYNIVHSCSITLALVFPKLKLYRGIDDACYENL